MVFARRLSVGCGGGVGYSSALEGGFDALTLSVRLGGITVLAKWRASALSFRALAPGRRDGSRVSPTVTSVTPRASSPSRRRLNGGELNGIEIGTSKPRLILKECQCYPLTLALRPHPIRGVGPVLARRGGIVRHTMETGASKVGIGSRDCEARFLVMSTSLTSPRPIRASASPVPPIGRSQAALWTPFFGAWVGAALVLPTTALRVSSSIV
jgi:hypothetical protein